MPRFALAKHHIALAAGSGIPSADDQIGQTIAIDIARTGDAAARVVKAINAVDPKSACAEIAEFDILCRRRQCRAYGQGERNGMGEWLNALPCVNGCSP